MIRNTFFLKSIAWFLVVNILSSVFYPTAALALSSGPSQPEFSSYESPNATDMVNLVTGDFTYTMPLLTIPGTGGSFSLPLAYHGGIRAEQDASWVGLGWSLNPGAITRSISQYPDDFAGETWATQIVNSGGNGYSLNFLVGTYSHDSEKGSGGTIGLSGMLAFGYGNQSGTGVVAGVNFGDGKVKVDPIGLSMTVLTVVGFWEAGIAEGAAASAAEEATGSVTETIAGAMKGLNDVSTAGSLGYGAIGSATQNYNFSHQGLHVKNRNYFFYQKYNYWFDTTRTDSAYGSLYLGDMPLGYNDIASYVWKAYLSGEETDCNYMNNPIYFPKDYENLTCSDMYMKLESGGPAVSWNPTSICYDAYNIMGSGVSGNIRPYRHEVGSLAFPFSMQALDFKSAIFPFLDYKVGFRYEGDYSNRYTYHKAQTSDGFGVGAVSCGDYYAIWNVYDPSLLENGQRIESDREGLINSMKMEGGYWIMHSKLVQGRNVEWYSNEEILNGTAQAYGFIDFLGSSADTSDPNPRWRTSTASDFRSLLPGKGIGGYSVTRPDGMTFHYALPVYNFQQANMSKDVTDPTKDNHTSSELYDPFAYEWLLTAITGPDFVDRGELGVIDDSDWGYWVKLDYGRFAQNYHWRSPYWDYDTPDNTNSFSYMEGLKETYYLNTIATHSHTALFVKSIRNDGRGAYAKDSTNYQSDLLKNLSDGQAYNDLYPSSSLKLSSIVLLKNEDYTSLLSNGSLKYETSSPYDTDLLANNDSFDEVADIYDVSDLGNFFELHQVKSILFHYDENLDGTDDYTLAPETHNSFSSVLHPPRDGNSISRSGRLTLYSITVYGQYAQTLFPDFQFEYTGYNPAYGADDWDGWGMYKSGGTTNIDSHHGSASGPDDAKAWSLTKITTPLGGTIEVDYEQDSYSSIAGDSIQVVIPVHSPVSTTEWRIYPDYSILAPHLADLLEEGQNVTFYLTQAYEVCDYKACTAINWLSESTYLILNETLPQVIQSLDSVSFVLSNPPPSLPEPNECCAIIGCKRKNCEVDTLYGTLQATVKQLNGGDLRVSQIRVSDGTTTFKTNYEYTQNGNPSGLTSGTVAKEPNYIKTYDYPFYDYYDFPLTPVMYNKVTVYQGELSDSSDYISAKEYTFTVPSSDMVTVNNNVSSFADESSSATDHAYLSQQNYLVDVNTSQIGSIEKIRTFDPYGTISESDFTYFNQKNVSDAQGVFTEGSTLQDAVQYIDSNDQLGIWVKFIRTTKTFYPSFLTSITTTRKGATQIVTNTEFDFYTGAVLTKEYTDALGVTYISQNVPAYTISQYQGMGPKGADSSHANMLTQLAASYLYKNSISTDNLVSASIQTWAQEDTMRAFDTGNLRNYYEAIPSDERVWRKKAAYVWNSPFLNGGGTYQNFVNFDWTETGLDKHWQKASEVSRYDVYSEMLETSDANGKPSAKKLANNNAYTICRVPFAHYPEIAYCGIEDGQASSSYNLYGGGVWSGGTGYTGLAHTGSTSLMIESSHNDLYYSAEVHSAYGLQLGRAYKVSVWVYGDGDVSPGFSYDPIPNSDVTLGEVKTEKVCGEWKLISQEITINNANPAAYNGEYLEMFIGNGGSSTAYVDDFRFQPSDVPMTSYVYDPQTKLLMYVIDGHNTYTHYTYTADGRLKTAYRETAKGEIKVSEYNYHYSRDGMTVK